MPPQETIKDLTVNINRKVYHLINCEWLMTRPVGFASWQDQSGFFIPPGRKI